MNTTSPATASPAPRLRLRVTATAETLLRGGHPWLFADSVHEMNRPGKTGELGVVFDRKDRFLAIGLFDPDSPIRLRVLHAGKPIQLDDTWWQQRLAGAVARRRGLFDALTTGFRWINGESDGWPGLVLDAYGDTLVMKIYTTAWLPRLGEVQALIAQQIPHERLVLRLSRNIQNAATTHWRLKDGQILSGPPLPEGRVIFLETGLAFEAEVLQGQKTGFFLDQRENRRHVESLAAGRSVLNAFSFSGGFSLYAARGGAREVASLDISAHALRSAVRNFELNRHLPPVAACRHEIIQADVFEWFQGGEARRFDLVILDPPSLAKREAERLEAIRAYTRLASAGLARLNRDGILVAASCSAHVSAEEFFTAVRSAARQTRRSFEELRTTGHAPDHAATFVEANYLKAIYLRVQ